MPAPLWEDAKAYLLAQGAPISTFNLNNAMNELAANPSLRPSYGGGPTTDVAGGMDVLSPQMQSTIQQTELASPIPSPAPVTRGRDEGYALPPPRMSSAPGNIARPPVPARDARAVRAEGGQVPVPTRKPPMGAPGSEPDPPGGAPPGPGQAVAGQPTNIPGSGSDDGMGLIGKLLAGAGLAAGVGGAAMAMRGGASAGMRPRGAPGLGIGGGLPGTPPGGGPGSGFAGAMGTPVPGGMAPGPGASPLTGTLPLGSVGGGGLAPSVTMPLPPPTVSLSTHGNVPMSGYGPTSGQANWPQGNIDPNTGLPIPGNSGALYGMPYSTPPDVINQGGPDIAGLLTGPRNVTKDASGPSAGGRIRSPRPRTPPTPKGKPTPKPAQRNKGKPSAADADQNDARTKRIRAAQNRSR